jgi:RNA polymerase sigma-32 factor
VNPAESDTHDDELVETEGEVVVDDGDEDPVPESKQPASLAPASMEGAALSRTDPLQAYLREVQRYKLLTAEEEQTLTRKYVETQDVQTAARLVTANLRLVVKLAYEYAAYKNIMDSSKRATRPSAGCEGHDPYRGVGFPVVRRLWIRAYILRFI